MSKCDLNIELFFWATVVKNLIFFHKNKLCTEVILKTSGCLKTSFNFQRRGKSVKFKRRNEVEIWYFLVEKKSDFLLIKKLLYLNELNNHDNNIIFWYSFLNLKLFYCPTMWTAIWLCVSVWAQKIPFPCYNYERIEIKLFSKKKYCLRSLF